MYQNEPFLGTSLPDKTICFTFDDGPGKTKVPGPGSHTLALAHRLSNLGVPATFFMVGKFASDLPGIVSQVEKLGHLIGNHSYDHPNLIDYANGGGDVVCQITRTDGPIRNWIDNPVVFVRPPYGAWNADIAGALNSSLTASLSHVGPIGWDIDGGDWEYWLNNMAPQLCVTKYIELIKAKRRGIILMHDCTADQDVVKRVNRTLELVQLLIPALRQQGYQFSRLDEVPDIKSSYNGPIRLALRGSNNQYVSPQGGGGGPIRVDGPMVGPWEPLVIEDLYVGKVALRATNGKYISPQNGGGSDVLANGPSVGEWEPLDLISFGDNKVAFRTITGHFLNCDTSAGNVLNAKDTWLSMPQSTIFTYEYLP